MSEALRLVIIESPFAGDVARNLRYLRACMRDCLLRGEAPYASHALYTQPGVLDDGKAEDRDLGIQAGCMWREMADATVVYTDLGITSGMQHGIDNAQKLDAKYSADFVQNLNVPTVHPIEYRQLGLDWEAKATELEATFKTRWP